MGKKLKIDDIDENFIINSFRQEEFTAPVEEQKTDTGDENMPENKVVSSTKRVSAEDSHRRKLKGREADFKELFLKEAAISARFGKTTYVRKEYHERIQRIVRVIGKDEVSLFSYIDNVLAHHFASFQDEITELYNMNNNSIF